MFKSAPYFAEIAKELIETLKLIFKRSEQQRWLEKFASLKQQFAMKNILANENFCVRYLNSFVHEGPHGNHHSIVYEYLGLTLDQLLRNSHLSEIPYSVVKKIFLQLAVGLKYLHEECNLNLKPENVMIQFPEGVQDEILEYQLGEDKFRFHKFINRVYIDQMEKSKIFTSEQSKLLKAMTKKERKKLRKKMKKKKKKMQAQ